MPRPSRLPIVVALALAASACTAPTTSVHPKASPSPAPSPAPSATATPLPGASPTASATPTPTPLPSPPASLAPAHASLRDTIETKLLAIAKLSFNQGRGQLASSGSLIGDAGSALIGNHSAGVISNNGGGIVANNGGGVIANNGAGYRLQASTPVTIATDAQPGETQVASRLWPDGMNLLIFKGAEGVSRTVEVRGGKPTHEELTELLERYPSGHPKLQRSTTTELIANGNVQVRLIQRSTASDAGATTHISMDPGSVVHDLVTGAEIDLEQLELDLESTTGSFRSRYGGAGLVEEGTLTNVKPNAVGQIIIAYWDPFVTFDGTARTTDADGKLLFGRTQQTVDGKKQRGYDLGDGLTMALTEQAEDRYEGTLSKDGAQQATVKLAVSADGSSVFTVTFPEEPTRPLVVGYGLSEAPVARPKSPPQWIVLTLAGAATAGYAEGGADVARFNQPNAFKAGRANPERYFLADGGNHRVRAMTRGPVAFTAYAGSGTAGYLDGPAASARFRTPYGLAVGPDDTLYVADQDDHRIRKIAPDGTVSTVAGDGTPGFADGKGTSARFNNPSGLALGADGTLYVADALNHAIRAIDPAGNVTTLAGDGTPGNADGTPGRFKIPIDVAEGPDLALYVADRDNNAIRKIANKVVSTVAGTQAAGRNYHDGPALTAGFNPPRCLAFGPDGLLYFTTAADVYTFGNGEVRSYAGSAGPGHVDGVNFVATFQDLAGLCFTPNKVLFLADDNYVRYLVPPQAP
jgi:hypothetical protein